MGEQIERQQHWRWKIAFYLFFAGTGAGAYMVAILADLSCGNCGSLAKTGVVLGAGFAMVGAPFLIIDLGRKGGFLRARANPRTAWISRGFYVLSIFAILALIHIGLWVWPSEFLDVERSLRLALGMVNGVFAFAAAAYTGFLLKSMKSIPFWDSPLVEIIFFLSAILTGSVSIALFSLGYLATDAGAVAWRLMARGHLVLLSLILILLAFQLVTMYREGQAAKQSVSCLIGGDLKTLFWGGVVIWGLVTPLILTTVAALHPESIPPGLTAVSCLLILSGALLLRYGILAAGVRRSPLLPNCR